MGWLEVMRVVIVAAYFVLWCMDRVGATGIPSFNMLAIDDEID